MEYHSVLKRKESLSNATTHMNLEDIKWNKPVTKRKTLYDSTYMSYPKPSNSETEDRMEIVRIWGEGEMEVAVEF